MDTRTSAGISRAELKPFLLAAFFDGKPTDGGGYVHKVGTLRVLLRMRSATLEVVVICDNREALKIVEEHGLRGVLQPRKGIRQLIGEVSAAQSARIYLGRSLAPRLSPVDRLLTTLGADLAFFPGPDRRALQLHSHSYVFSILDLAHLEHPEFPEVSLSGEFERREQLYADATRRAVAVVADSEQGRRLVVEQYRVPAARVFVAPFMMALSVQKFVADEVIAVSVRQRYAITDPYIFYPAQFWAHKNHRYLLAALRVMRERHGWAPQAVFCGSDKGELGAVREYADRAGVDDLMNYCGFVPDEHLPYLYAGALALVMPTYFGPTNIPPLEALRLGVPVCYSDLPSFREHLGDTVTYVDLQDPASLADALQRIRTEGRLPQRSAELVPGIQPGTADDAYFRVLSEIVERFRYKTQGPVIGG
jgi:glycosyltransferase involved in cell wall biosynthesis